MAIDPENTPIRSPVLDINTPLPILYGGGTLLANVEETAYPVQRERKFIILYVPDPNLGTLKETKSDLHFLTENITSEELELIRDLDGFYHTLKRGSTYKVRIEKWVWLLIDLYMCRFLRLTPVISSSSCYA